MTTKFTFIAESEDGSVSTVTSTRTRWFETFDDYINFLRGAGFILQDVELLAPHIHLTESDLFCNIRTSDS